MKASRRQVLATLAAVPALALVGGVKAGGKKKGLVYPGISAYLTAHRWDIVATLVAMGASDEEFQVAYGEALAQTMETVELIG